MMLCNSGAMPSYVGSTNKILVLKLNLKTFEIVFITNSVPYKMGNLFC